MSGHKEQVVSSGLLSMLESDEFSNYQLGIKLNETISELKRELIGAGELNINDDLIERSLSDSMGAQIEIADYGAFILAIRAAENEEYDKSGWILRSYIKQTAKIEKHLPQSEERYRQFNRDLGKYADENRAIGANNREAVRAARDKYIASLGDAKVPSKNKIAKAIAGFVNLKVSATWRHLKALEEE